MVYLFQPSRWVPTIQAALLGGLALVLTAWFASIGQLVTDGVLDIHFLALSPIEPADLPRFVANVLQGLTNLLWMTATLWLAGLFIGHRQSIPTLLAHQALARWPLAVASGYLAIPWVGGRIYELTLELIHALPDPANPVMAPARYLLPAIELTAWSAPLLFCIGWMVWLMFDAYRTLTQAPTPQLVVSFIAALVLAEALSKLTIW